jgi:hypothetical protein
MAPPLADALLSPGLTEAAIRGETAAIQQALLASSRFIRQPNFTSIHPEDLGFLYEAYDRRFFQGRFREALNGTRLEFRLSPRMTKAAGTTSRFRDRRSGVVSYEIAIGSSLLFDGFRDGDRGITACGLACPTRIDALQRVFEHELIHLGEQLCWQESNCSAPRFQRLAACWFLHASHTHALITRRDRAEEMGIKTGAMVEFYYEGRRLSGRVNRVTKRATVLVPDPNGARFTDGSRYLIYYVPIQTLRLARNPSPQPESVPTAHTPASR